MSAEDDDAQLVAFIDRQLDENARSALEARLARDALLRERLARLQEGGRPFAPAFQALLDAAPVERLQAALGGDQRGEAARPQRLRLSRLAVAAAAILLFCLGILVGRYGPGRFGDDPRREDWREAVAEYMSLYTSDTFAAEPPAHDDDLAALGAKIGLDLSVERVGLANLQFKDGEIFAYDGAPLVQLAYLDPASGPVLFCIIRNSESDAPMAAGRRDGFAVASWARGGRGYMLIGRLAVTQMAGLADSLQRRF
jgi:anti-sigma factor RsiW